MERIEGTGTKKIAEEGLDVNGLDPFSAFSALLWDEDGSSPSLKRYRLKLTGSFI